MKMIIVLAAILAVALAVPVPADNEVTILRYDNDNIGVDAYKFDFETSDGTSHSQSGELKNAGAEDESISVRGSFSYIVDGVTYTVNYVADENGFQPEGEHLPKA